MTMVPPAQNLSNPHGYGYYADVTTGSLPDNHGCGYAYAYSYNNHHHNHDHHPCLLAPDLILGIASSNNNNNYNIMAQAQAQADQEQSRNSYSTEAAASNITDQGSSWLQLGIAGTTEQLARSTSASWTPPPPSPPSHHHHHHHHHHHPDHNHHHHDHHRHQQRRPELTAPMEGAGLMLKLNLDGATNNNLISKSSNFNTAISKEVCAIDAYAVPQHHDQTQMPNGFIRAVHAHHHQPTTFLAASSLSPSLASRKTTTPPPPTSTTRPSPFTSPQHDRVDGATWPILDFRVIHPPPAIPHSHIWFMLQASPNQLKEPFLAQVPKSFLRIKDGRMTVGIVVKYVANKLGLDNESEVEIRCRGQKVVPSLTLQHVRDQIWRQSRGHDDDDTHVSMTLLPQYSSTSDHLMLLHYGRS